MQTALIDFGVYLKSDKYWAPRFGLKSLEVSLNFSLNLNY